MRFFFFRYKYSSSFFFLFSESVFLVGRGLKLSNRGVVLRKKKRCASNRGGHASSDPYPFRAFGKMGTEPKMRTKRCLQKNHVVYQRTKMILRNPLASPVRGGARQNDHAPSRAFGWAQKAIYAGSIVISLDAGYRGDAEDFQPERQLIRRLLYSPALRKWGPYVTPPQKSFVHRTAVGRVARTNVFDATFRVRG